MALSGRSPSAACWTEVGVLAPPGEYARLLVDVVQPLLADMVARGIVRRWFFWPDRGRDGPCLRLCAQGLRAGAGGVVGERLRNATDNVALEQVATPTLIAAMGWGAPSRAVAEDLLSDLTPRLVTLLKDGGHGSLDVGLELMTAHLVAVGDSAVAEALRPADSSAGDAFLGFLSYRSHAEGFFLMCEDPERARRAFEERYLTAAAVLGRRVRAVLDQFGDGGPVVSRTATWWHDAVRRHLPAAVESFRARDGADDAPDEMGYLGNAHDLRDSPFHQVIDDAAGFQVFLRTDPTFQAVRLLTSILYLCLQAVGLRLIDRYFLCHAISNTCESLYRVDSVELVSRFANHHGALPGSGRSSETAPVAHVAESDRPSCDEATRGHKHRRLAVALSQKEKP
jgi:hypothetical protein